MVSVWYFSLFSLSTIFSFFFLLLPVALAFSRWQSCRSLTARCHFAQLRVEISCPVGRARCGGPWLRRGPVCPTSALSAARWPGQPSRGSATKTRRGPVCPTSALRAVRWPGQPSRGLGNQNSTRLVRASPPTPAPPGSDVPARSGPPPPGPPHQLDAES